MEQTIPKANDLVLLFTSFHFMTMHMYCKCHKVSCEGGVGVVNHGGHKSLTTACGLVIFWFHKCTGHLLFFVQWAIHVEGLEQVIYAVIVTAD